MTVPAAGYQRAMRTLEEIARELVLATSPFMSAWELSHDVDGEALHAEMLEALGITRDEWHALRR